MELLSNYEYINQLYLRAFFDRRGRGQVKNEQEERD